jgi:hypothetical protein
LLAADFDRHQPTNQPNSVLITRNNSDIRVYYSNYQGESQYPFYFSIGLMILWQKAQKHKNYVGGGGTLLGCRSLTIARHPPSSPPNTILIIMNNSNIGVYNSVFQGESEYQLFFSVGFMVLWKNAKNAQNYVQIKLGIPLQSHSNSMSFLRSNSMSVLIFRGGAYDLITYDRRSNSMLIDLYIRGRRI